MGNFVETRAQSSKRIAALDGLRVIAISFVIMSHSIYLPGFPDWLHRHWRMSGFGVMLFLVLSGYTVTNQLLTLEDRNGQIPFTEFYLRRWLRQWPSIALFVVGCGLLDVFSLIQFTPRELLGALSFTRNLTEGTYFTRHLWSLCVQQQFFFIWPLVLILAPKNQRLKIAITLVVLQPIWSWINANLLGGTTFLARPDLRSAPLLVGAALALAHAKEHLLERIEKLSISKTPGLLSGVALLVFERLYLNGGDFLFAKQIARLTMYLGMALSINYLVIASCAPVTRLLSSSPMVWMGQLGFQLYIWQQLFAANGGLWWQRFPDNLFYIFAIAVSTYFLLERPLITRGNQFAKRLAAMVCRRPLNSATENAPR